MYHIIRLKNFLSKIVFVLILSIPFMSSSFGQGDLGWRWMFTTMEVRSLAPQLHAQMGHLFNEISSETNITASLGPSNTNPPFSGDVAYVDLSIGATTTVAVAVPVSSFGLDCSDAQTGNINFANCPAGTLIEFGAIYMNTNNPFATNPTAAEAQHLLVHEMGHILGMSHDICNPWAIIFGIPLPPISIMAPSISDLGCTPPFTMYQAPDTSLLNVWYP